MKNNCLRAALLAVFSVFLVTANASADAQFRFRAGGEWCAPAVLSSPWDNDLPQYAVALHGLTPILDESNRTSVQCPIPNSPEFVELVNISPQNRKLSFVQLFIYATDTSGSKEARASLYTYDYDATGFCTCDTDIKTTFTSGTFVQFTLDFLGDADPNDGCTVAECGAGWTSDWLINVDVSTNFGTQMTVKSIAALDTST